ncbi:MAG: hypothetical protein HZC48_02180 [Nitrospirae bacterium]|nr:hypothetical protein [Nitrospirota bacterium]
MRNGYKYGMDYHIYPSFIFT